MTDLLNDLSKSTIAKGVLVASTLILSWALPRLLPVEAVGDYYFLLNSVAFFGLASTIAIEDHALTTLPSAKGSHRHGSLGAIVSVTLLTAALLAPLIVTTFLIFTPIPGDETGLLLSIGLITLWTLTLGIQRVFGETIRARGEIAKAVLLGIRSRFGSPVTSGALVIVLCACIVFGVQLNLWSVITISVAVSVLGATLCSRFVVVQGLDWRDFRIGPREARKVFESSMPYLGAKVAAFLSRYIDIWIAGFILTREELGVYAVVATLAASINLPLALTNDIVPNLVGRLLSMGNRVQLQATLQALSGLALLAALIGVGICAVGGGYILGVFYGAEYASGYHILVVLALAHLTSPIVGSAGIVLVVDGQRGSLLKATWSGVAVFLVIGLLGAGYLGPIGLAFGALAARLTTEALKAYYCNMECGVRTTARIREGMRLLWRWRAAEMD